MVLLSLEIPYNAPAEQSVQFHTNRRIDMTNVVPLHPKTPQKGKNHRPCSLVAVSDKGNTVYGTAALLVVTKRAGGVDSYETEIAAKGAEIALRRVFGSNKKSGGFRVANNDINQYFGAGFF